MMYKHYLDEVLIWLCNCLLSVLLLCYTIRMDCLSKREDRSTAARAGWRGGIGPSLVLLAFPLPLLLPGMQAPLASV